MADWEGLKMDLVLIRARSLATAKSLGYLEAKVLPLLDGPPILRPVREIEDRALALGVVCAACFGDGFDRQKGLDWIEKESISKGFNTFRDRLPQEP